MKTHAIIPVFIPHEGCPHDCVFCNQRAITARESAPDAGQTRNLIENHLSTIRQNPNIAEREIAFFGGSFTGIEAQKQEMYLSIAKEYKDRGEIDRIRLSTRPDYIDEEVLDRLQRYGADIVELGVQSFDETVLNLSGRGHDRSAVFSAARQIKERGLTLGIQLMVGLPGDSYEKCMASVAETVKIRPSVVRIYPTVVLKDTALYEMYRRGLYQPLTEEEAVNTVKDMLREFDRQNIEVIRVGLKSSDLVGPESGAIGAGTYHPAFRQLVESAMAREDLENLLTDELKIYAVEMAAQAVTYSAALCDYKNRDERGRGKTPQQMYRNGAVRNDAKRRKVTFYAVPESFSNMVGLKRANKLYFAETYPQLNFKFSTDPTLDRNCYRVTVKD